MELESDDASFLVVKRIVVDLALEVRPKASCDRVFSHLDAGLLRAVVEFGNDLHSCPALDATPIDGRKGTQGRAFEVGFLIEFDQHRRTPLFNEGYSTRRTCVRPG